VSIVVALLLVAFLCVRQTRPQEVDEQRGLRLIVLFGLIGLAQLATALTAEQVSTVAVACVAVSLVIEGALGGLRGALVAIYRDHGRLVSRGSTTTVALWIISVAVHFGGEAIAHRIDPSSTGIADATLLLGVVLSLGVQKFVTLRRSQRTARPIDRRE
jgi:hypothetical protein